jgi:hypothetical protein
MIVSKILSSFWESYQTLPDPTPKAARKAFEFGKKIHFIPPSD